MQYTSTRDKSRKVGASFAIANGISAEGGLFVPEMIPKVDRAFLASLCEKEYSERAEQLLSLFLTDFTPKEIHKAVEAAYGENVFEEDWVAPISDLSDGRFILELYHGPTCAFKDLALQLLPHLMTAAAKRALGGKKILILVATSGDTGKAALEGFCDVDGVKIAVFYPNEGVSAMQRLQMATQQGENVAVYAIEGNFDDAQTAVKSIFTDQAMQEKLAAEQVVLSSANSINWGRLVPQIVYYFSAYADLVGCEVLKLGDPVNFVVPTGNFGNILAGYYAKCMGLPVHRLICASNQNNVLTDFLRTGVYDANREFFVTDSPSMDILISSNLERLLFALNGGDDAEIRSWMEALSTDRKYTVSPAVQQKLSAEFWGGSVDDAACRRMIADTLEDIGYLADPHTAVALAVYEQYKAETKDMTPTILLSTASPFKFCPTVLEALGAKATGNAFEAARTLSRGTGAPIPDSIVLLERRATRFTEVISPDEMAAAVLSFAKKK